MYVQLNHFAVHRKLTQHCKSTVLQLKKKKNIFRQNQREFFIRRPVIQQMHMFFKQKERVLQCKQRTKE